MRAVVVVHDMPDSRAGLFAGRADTCSPLDAGRSAANGRSDWSLGVRLGGSPSWSGCAGPVATRALGFYRRSV
jgi:hypothetical protein